MKIPQDNITPYGTALKTFQDKYLRKKRSIDRFRQFQSFNNSNSVLKSVNNNSRVKGPEQNGTD